MYGVIGSKTQWMEVCGKQNGERAGAHWVDVIGQVLDKWLQVSQSKASGSKEHEEVGESLLHGIGLGTGVTDNGVKSHINQDSPAEATFQSVRQKKKKNLREEPSRDKETHRKPEQYHQRDHFSAH